MPSPSFTFRKSSRSPGRRNEQPPDQLSNLRRQWNVQRDIPAGTVRNNPFLPKRDQREPQEQREPGSEPGFSSKPQLTQQKKQWSTATIQRGSVAARASSLQAETTAPSAPPPTSRVSPKVQQNRNKFDRHGTHGGNQRRASPISMAPKERNSPASHPKMSPRPTQAFTFENFNQPTNQDSRLSHTVQAATSLRGKMIENAGFSDPPAPEKNIGRRWEPSKEIPMGAVKSRVNKLVGTSDLQAPAPQVNLHSAAIEKKSQPKLRQEMSEDDPWIIPDGSGSVKLEEENWGTALSTKSGESDTWDTPDVDWVKSSDSTKESPEQDFPTGVRSNLALRGNNPIDIEIFEEKKVGEEDPLGGRESNILFAQHQKKIQQEVDMFETAHEREHDIFQAAKKKVSTQKLQTAVAEFESRLFPATSEPKEEFDAFPLSPFGGPNQFRAFNDTPFPTAAATSETSRNIKHEKRITRENVNKEQMKPVQRCEPPMNHGTATNVDPVDSYEEPNKNDRKGFFGKLFGGRKGRKSSDAHQRDSLLQKTDAVTVDRGLLRVSPQAISVPEEKSQEFDAVSSASSGNFNLSTSVSFKEIEDETGVRETSPSSILSETIVSTHQVGMMESMETNYEPEQATTVGTSGADDEVGTFYGISEDSRDDRISEELRDADSPQGFQQDSFEDCVSNSEYPHLLSPPPPPPRIEQEMDPMTKLRMEIISDVSHRASGFGTAQDAERLNRKVKEFKKNSHSRVISQSHGTQGKDAIPWKKIPNTSEQATHPNNSKINSRVVSQSHPAHGKNLHPLKYDPAITAARVTRTNDTTINSRVVSQRLPTQGKNLYKLKYVPEATERAIHTNDNKINNSRLTKFPHAARAYQQVGKPHLMSSGMASSDTAKNDNLQATFSQDSGVHRQRSHESSSVESDIRVLRTILRRPRKGRDLRPITRPKQVFATYNDEATMDPMQRAGLRLLSAAVIPIQTEIRRFLAMRQALTRMWALIVIQSHGRRHLVRMQYLEDRKAVIRVQALARGNLERNELIYRHICAIEIQRHVRGYLSTMRVYEEIYKVTMIQSLVRMKLAMEEATNRMAHLIQLQSVARGFVVRHRLEREHAAATTIQANWRSFFTRLNYQFDLLDVIIVQSVWRRKTAIAQARSRREQLEREARIQRERLEREARIRHEELENRSATVIQTRWRSYDSAMNYLHFLADVLICQSAARRFLVMNQVRKQKAAATRIQCIWRGFVSYADYMFSIADIISVQKMARKWLSLRRVRALREDRDQNAAALVIQKKWRGFVAETEYVVMKYEHYAARTIQTYWRHFWNFSNYVIVLDCTIQIQRAYRAHCRRVVAARMNAVSKIERTYLLHRQWKLMKTLRDVSERQAKVDSMSVIRIQTSFRGMQARVAVKKGISAQRIQAMVRGNQARTAVSFYLAARRIQAMWRCKRMRSAYKFYRSALVIQAMWRCKRLQGAYNRYRAACRIQAAWRGKRLCDAYRCYRSARMIQAAWRGKRLCDAYRCYRSARMIQAAWRGKRMHSAYKFYCCARLIQTRIRSMRARRELLVLRGEYLAASLIQSAWRGFVCYTDYIFTISDIIAAQKVARRYIARKKYGGVIKDRVAFKKRMTEAATTVQKVCRGFTVRQRYWYILGCTMQIQSWMRGRVVKLRIRREAAARLKLQCFGRRCLARQEYLQRKFILALLKTADQEKTKRVAVRVNQEKARGFLEERKRDEAARTIQRFFLMVKREVDRMVLATKRRKKWRKKMSKTRNSKVEDTLLEDAWGSVDPLLTLGMESLRQSSSHGSSGHNENIRMNTLKSGYVSGKQVGKVKRDPFTDLKSKKPPPHFDVPLSQDEKTEFSGLTMSTAAFSRISKSRMKCRESHKTNEDIELEQAFIDFEARKGRRLTST